MAERRFDEVYDELVAHPEFVSRFRLFAFTVPEILNLRKAIAALDTTAGDLTTRLLEEARNG
jgi:hypothetical protein